MYIRTGKAFSLPFIAIYMFKETAMPGYRPSVMKGPYYRFACLFKVFKQDRYAYIISMYVVQVDNVGIYLPEFLD